MEFRVSQERFSGPLDVLLELLAKKELDITEVNLASIAGDYLAFLETNRVPSGQMADFLYMASRLIYTKSRELMPQMDVQEEPGGSIEDQLRIYREFSQAADKLQDQFSNADIAFSRPFFAKVIQKDPVFSPAQNITLESLHASFNTLLKRLEPFFALNSTSIERVKSVDQRIKELRKAIESRSNVSFKLMTKDAKSKAEVVVSFLALLELMRRQVVRAVQKDENDIMIRSYE